MDYQIRIRTLFYILVVAAIGRLFYRAGEVTDSMRNMDAHFGLHRDHVRGRFESLGKTIDALEKRVSAAEKPAPRAGDRA